MNIPTPVFRATPAFKITPAFFKDFTWLIEKCDSSDEITHSDKDKYKYVIFYLKQIIATFLFIRKHDHDDGILEQHIKPNYVPFFKNPEFLFDDYIYHTPHGTSNKKTYLEKCKYPKYIEGFVKPLENLRFSDQAAQNLDSLSRISEGNPTKNDDESESITVYGFLKGFEYIFYYVLNRTDEYDYDVIMKKNIIGVKRTEPRPDPLRTATPKVGGSRLQASIADPSGCLDGSKRFLDSTSSIFFAKLENPMSNVPSNKTEHTD